MAGHKVLGAALVLLFLCSVGSFVEGTQHRLMLQTCGEGQVANTQGVCTECADGYIRTSTSPLVCSKCPCLSLGSCQFDSATAQAVCICPRTYYGVSTAAGILCLQCPGSNSTTGAQCSGHGTCQADSSGAANPTCSCAATWTGSDCASCTLGYTGADCQECADGFVSVSGQCVACPGYCSGAQGTCQDVAGSATCQCSTGWSGEKCDRPDTANGYFLVYDESGNLINGTVSSSPQHCTSSLDCGFSAACIDSLCECSAGFTTAGSWYRAGSMGIKCSACPLGSYRGDVSTLPCTSCPYNVSTTAVPGSTSPDQCIACSNDQMVCATGSSFNPATCLCEEGSASVAGLNVGSKVAIGILVPFAFIVLLAAGSVYVVRMRKEKRATGAYSPDSPGAQVTGLPTAGSSAPSAPMTDIERRENDSM